jgi:hypothetical protein
MMLDDAVGRSARSNAIDREKAVDGEPWVGHPDHETL